MFLNITIHIGIRINSICSISNIGSNMIRTTSSTSCTISSTCSPTSRIQYTNHAALKSLFVIPQLLNADHSWPEPVIGPRLTP